MGKVLDKSFRQKRRQQAVDPHHVIVSNVMVGITRSKVIECFFFYDFDMILLWFCYGFDMVKNMVLLWFQSAISEGYDFQYDFCMV